jgi:hypothetical protein
MFRSIHVFALSVLFSAIACLPAAAKAHSADVTQDQVISLSELLRVVQLFNFPTFGCADDTEDGYDPLSTEQNCTPHDSDYNPQDWNITLSELLRVVQFFNSGGYHTKCGTEDDFAPGDDIDQGCIPEIKSVTPSLTETSGDTVVLSGLASPNATIRVNGGASVTNTTADDEGNFEVSVSLRGNRLNYLFVTAENELNEKSAPLAVQVLQDAQAPGVFIDFPADGSVVTTETITVAGRVSDILSGFMGLSVDVQGQPAAVAIGIGTNGTFDKPGVALALGPNVITARAEDALGNVLEKQITITREAPTGVRMAATSGDSQSAQVYNVLPQPLRILMTHPNGDPFPGKNVTFQVTRSNGLIGEASNDLEARARSVQVSTDANGEAEVYFWMGSDAGCGNNRVAVTSTGVSGTTYFCATALPGPASQINIGSGNNQYLEAGAVATEPLRAWVNDSCNGLPDIAVTFTVTQGGGKVNGEDSVTVLTGETGHASVAFTLGASTGNNFVEADFEGNPGVPATFVAFGLARTEGLPTSFSGIVFDNTFQPIEGAPCTLVVNNTSIYSDVVTDAQGQFTFDDIVDGPAQFFVDGLQATAVGGLAVPPGSFPGLSYNLIIVPNAENTLPNPVQLPPLDPDNAVLYDGTQDIELTLEGLEGLTMRVKAGSMTRPNGTKPSPADPQIISLNQVQHDAIPMPMPDGVAPPFAWTLQPAGATFDPPVEVTYPNMAGLDPGAISYFLSYNHGTEKFEIVSSGSVSEDGSVITTDPGSGITISGWGGNCPPYSITGIVKGILVDPEFDITLFANGQPYRVDEDGVYCIFNITAPDEFGPGGPGTPPDFKADDKISVIGVGIGRGARKGEIKYYTSDLFYVEQNEVVTVNSFSSGADPPEFPKALRIVADPVTFPPATTSQVTTTAIYYDGTEKDVTPVSSGTNYRVSNTDIITIDEVALVTSYIRGPAFVTATHEGVTATRRVNIAVETITTRVEGFVVDENGNPIEGATISTISFGGDVTTDANGFFSFDLILPGATENIVVTVNFDGNEFDSGLITVIPGGVTDVGFLTNVPVPFTTTVAGQVRFENDTPAMGAQVFTSLGGSGVSDANGDFSFTLMAIDDGALPELSVTARIEGAPDTLAGRVTGLTILPDDTTSAGTIILRPIPDIPYPGARSAMGGVPVDIELGDMNGDGLFDVVSPLYSTTSSNPYARVNVNLSNGDGTYQEALFQDVGESPTDLVLGLFNADGFLDAAIADSMRDSVYILLGNGDGTFLPGVEYPGGSQPLRIDAGYINGDAFLDIVIGNNGERSVTFFLGNGDGTLQAPTTLTIGGNQNSLTPVLEDMDKDGNSDLLVAHRGEARVEFHKGNGDGTFAEAVNFTTPTAPDQVVIGDFNNDTNLDIALGTFSAGVSILLGDGAGNFGEHVEYPVTGNIRGLRAANFDDDGALDLLVPISNGNFDHITVLFGNGDGSFLPEQILEMPRFTRIAEADDTDGDGHSDIVALIAGGYGDISVLRGKEGREFETQRIIPTGNFGNIGLAVVDMNGDEHEDLVTARVTGNKILVLLGDGAVEFAAPLEHDSAANLEDLIVANVNNDAFPDVVTAHRNTDQIGVLLGNGDGTLQDAFFLAATADVRTVAAGDIDRDGKLDILSAPGPSGGVEVRLGIDGLTFEAAYEITTQSSTIDVFVGDVDDDKNLDMVLTRSSTLVLYLGNGDGSFAAARNLQIGGVSVVIIDIDKDGRSDIVTGDREGMLSILPGIGDGFFSAAVRYDLNQHNDPATLGYLVIEDINLDGNYDAVFSYEPFQCVGTLLGDGDRGFSDLRRYDLGGTFTSGIQLGDVNSDGLPDIIGANRGGNNLSVLLHR